MGSIIKIKRSSNPGTPTILGQGEMAYSFASGTVSTLGDRLFIGTGTETTGNAAVHSAVGGLYYTRLIDASQPGILTTDSNSIPVLSSTGTIDEWYAGNTYIYGNVITTTGTNEDLVLDPAGTGTVKINSYKMPIDAGTNNYVLTTNGSNTAIWSAGTTYIGATAINLFNSTGTVGTLDSVNLQGGNYNGNYVKVSDVGFGPALGTTNSDSAVRIETGASGTVGHTWLFNANGTTTFNSAYTLPAADGAAAGYILKTDGSGAISFAEPKIYIGTTSINLFNSSGGTSSLAVDISGKATTAGTADKVANVLTAGTDLQFTTGTTYDGSVALTANVTSTLANVVARGNTTTSGITVGSLSIGSAYTLPIVAGSDGYILKTYANGFVYWSAVASNQIQSDYTQTDTNAVDFIKNKPTTFATYLNLTGDSGSGNVAQLTDTVDFVGIAPLNFVVSKTSTTVSVTADVANASTAGTIGVSTFDGDNFSITNAKVSIKAGGITNASLANANVVIGSTTVNLGQTVTEFTGLTSFQVGNIKIFSDNQITSQETNGNINLITNGVGVIDVHNTRISGVADPTGPYDAANRSYVDAVANGFHVHTPAQVATHSNLATITGDTVTYNNGTDGVGATLTLSTAITAIDGITYLTSNFPDGSRILVKDEANTAHNGIYTINTAGTILTRATDFDTAVEVGGGDFIFVEHGDIYGSTGWVQVEDTDVIGTHVIVFSQFAGVGTYKAGIGLYLDGTTFNANVNSSSGGIEVVANQFQLKSSLAGNGLTYTTGVLNIGGTSDRITIASDAIDIAATYTGQSSITTLGNITTGTWSGNTVGTYAGGTGFSSYSSYDLLVGNASTSGLSILSKGNGGQILQMNTAGTALVYADLDGGSY